MKNKAEFYLSFRDVLALFQSGPTIHLQWQKGTEQDGMSNTGMS